MKLNEVRIKKSSLLYNLKSNLFWLFWNLLSIYSNTLSSAGPVETGNLVLKSSTFCLLFLVIFISFCCWSLVLVVVFSLHPSANHYPGCALFAFLRTCNFNHGCTKLLYFIKMFRTDFAQWSKLSIVNYYIVFFSKYKPLTLFLYVIPPTPWLSFLALIFLCRHYLTH